jgi:signal transduction histidine kinase
MASFLLGFHVTRSITRPLRDLKRAAHQLAFSDFHLRLETHSKDELADVGRDLMAAARQLEASYNALKRSNQDLERFAAAVSHDLREPLRTVTMFTQLLKADHESAFQGEASEYLKLISDAAFQMNRLIDGILQYSLVTSTQGHDLEDLPLYEVVRTAISNLRVAIDETGTTVHCGFLPVIRANRVQMEQIFQNLIGNAIKYRREGIPPHIEIEAREKGQDWIISVADNGTGIDPRYHERIFGIFRQLDRHSEGIGLGLAVAKRIIEQLGGSIWVESDGQNGSRFFLAIPRISSFNTRTADTEPEASMT